MKKMLLIGALLLLGWQGAHAQEITRLTSKEATVVVRPDVEKGPVKPMNAVNNGPERTDHPEQQIDNFEVYKAARFPYARTHDASYNPDYGGDHTVDITAVFPDFSCDPAKEGSYDFAVTDRYLRNIKDAGTEVFFRLGQRIEHTVKKYHVGPPADYKKWARICEHVIRHYNEGWADGMHLGIVYWEIWNEPDLDERTWGGTAEQFYDLYEVTAKHLKKCFPSLKIGGPAACGNLGWDEAFIREMARRKVPMDFFSWHRYTVYPSRIVDKAEKFRAMLDGNGYRETESVLNEWNYIRNWSTKYAYSLDRMRSVKGAAFVAAVMSASQDTSIDMLMYYDARTDTKFNGLFDPVTLLPAPPYYALYAWSHLLYDYGTQVEAVSGEEDIYVTAARSPEGRLGLLVTRYSEDNNDVAPRQVEIRLEGGAVPGGNLRAHLMDTGRIYTEVPLTCRDGVITVTLAPWSFIFVEL